MTIEQGNSLVGVVLVPLFVGVVGSLAGLTVSPLVGGLGFVTGTVLSLVVGANVDSDDQSQDRIEELESRVEELEAESETVATSGGPNDEADS